MEKLQRYQHFSEEKRALSVAMRTEVIMEEYLMIIWENFLLVLDKTYVEKLEKISQECHQILLLMNPSVYIYMYQNV